MRAGRHDERQRRELETAADELFDTIYPEDLVALLAKLGSRSKLRDAVVDCAVKVGDKFAKAGDPVTATERLRLIAATLT